MRGRNFIVVAMLIGMAVLFAKPGSALAPQRVIDDNDTLVLRGNVHPLAQPEADMGAAPLALPMERMILSLRMSPYAQARLARLLAEQQDPSSPNYHRWLTPEQFGQMFGPSQDDLDEITGWLQSHGFAVDEVAKGRLWINFTGTVADVERAFHTQIHEYVVNEKVHHANAYDPAIPRALGDVVAGVITLHDFRRQPMNTGVHRLSPEELNPLYTSGSSHYLSPGDFAIVYNVNAVYSAGYDGTGRTIGIVARTHPSSTNWSTFRSTMNLPANAPQVVVNGTDPGDLGASEDGECDLDVEWSGAVGKMATVKVVISKSTATTDGVDLSAQYIVNNNLTDVMSTSFGQCESQMGSSENTFYNNLWSQAASQGITSFVSSGDSGASGCDSGSSSSGSGLAVSGLSSTPYNVCVGGTQFNDTASPSTYWNSTNSTGDVSAKSYIPEIAWNESGNVSGGSGLWASGGGVSTIYAKPSWQVCTGVPADGKRDVPDVSLSAAGHDGYLVETQGSLAAIGGTSASSPSFAGLMSLVVQKTGARQGNANTVFYQLANAQYGSGGTVIFHDTTSGNNSVPGVTGYSCGTGYDMVTGVGSVDANALVNNWGGSATPDFTISASPTSVSVAQGGSGTSTITTAVSGGFNNAISLSASGLPTGASASFNPTSIAAPGSGTSTLTLTAGSSTATGTYTVTVTGTGGSTTHTVNISFTVTSSGGSSLTNGGFETGNFSGWTTSGTASVLAGAAHSGSYGAQLGSTSPTNGDSSAVQTFTLPSGSPKLSFWYNNHCPDTVTYDWATATVKDNSTGTTATVLAKTCATTAAWTNVTYDLSSMAGHSVTLTLTSHDDNYSGDATYTWYDDVTIQIPSPDFTVSTSPTSVSAAQGASATTTVTTAVSGGFNNAISLSASGLPTGASASFNPSSIAAPGSGSSTLTLTAGSSTPTGTYTVTVTATGGSITHTATVSFTVTASGGATTLFSNGFESSSGWYTAQVSGTSGAWSLVTSGTYPTCSPHGGSYMAKFNSYTASSGAKTRLYRNSGFAVSSSYTTVTLKFWMYHDTGYSSYNDQVQAQVSTNGSTWNNVGSAISRYNGSTGWAQVTIDISSYKGQTVYLGFVGISAYGNNEFLDDVTVVAQ